MHVRSLVLLTLLALAAPAGAAALDWPTFRHDARRTGRAAGAGEIRVPAIAWRYPVGGRRALVELSGKAGRRALSVPFGKDAAPDSFGALAGEWDASCRALDLAGDGKPVRVRESTNVRYARFLPGAAGFQKFVMEDGMAVKSRPDGPKRPVARGSLFRYDHGREEMVWQTAPEEQCEGPLCAVADMDGDGALDIAVSTWWRVMVFDGATGRKKMECRWHNGRNYGHFEVADLDGSGRLRPVVLADFMIHLDVLDNDGKNLSLRWRKEVDFRLFQKRKAVRVGPRPLVSLRGDNRRQIALNVHNDAGDGQWHAVVYDALSGDVLADLPRRFLHGAADLDGDGRTDLLLSEANGLATPLAGGLSVGRWRGERLEEEPVPVRGRWLTYRETALPPTLASIAAGSDRTALVTDLNGDGAGEAWIVAPADRRAGERLLALTPRHGGGWSEAARCDLPARVRVSVAAVRPAEGGRTAPPGPSESKGPAAPGGAPAPGEPAGGGRPAALSDRGLPTAVLLSLETPAAANARVSLSGVHGDLRAVGSLPLPPDSPVAGRMAAGGPMVIAVAAAGEVVALTASRGTPKELWRAPGRAQTTDMSRFCGLEMADLDGDGGLEVIAADRVEGGQAALVAYGASGKGIWRHVFARFAGSDPVWNTGGLLLWAAGRFLQPGRIDVVASLRRTAMHTDETCVVDVAANSEAWWQDNLDERGCGGAPLALRESSDGRHDIIGQYPDIHFALSGATGKPLSLWQFPHKELGGWSGYAMPTLLNPGEGSVLMGRCNYALALWTRDGKMLWHTPYLDGTSTAPALADLNGDGRLAIGAVAYRGGFRCYDPETGSVRWSYPAASGHDPVAGDVDGDGRDEFLLAAGKSLVALAEAGGQPRVVWEIALPAAPHSPILADVDGDGRLEVLCTAADGALYCVDAAGR